MARRDRLAAMQMAIVGTTSPVQRTIGGIQPGMYLRYPEVRPAAINRACRAVHHSLLIPISLIKRPYFAS
jgi:hypothetical protein